MRSKSGKFQTHNLKKVEMLAENSVGFLLVVWVISGTSNANKKFAVFFISILQEIE